MKVKLLILLSLTVLFGCNEKNDDLITSINSIPTTIGTKWTYDKQVIINEFESVSSDKIIKRDTMNFVQTTWIEKDTIINNTTKLLVFKTIDTEYSWITYEYKEINHQGLTKYGYSYNDSAIMLSSPLLELALPLSIGTSWTLSLPTDGYSIQLIKTAVSAEELKIIGQNFTCYKIKWEYINSPFNDKLKVEEWFSEQGLTKKVSSFYRIFDSIDVQSNTNDNKQVIITLTLKSINVK